MMLNTLIFEGKVSMTPDSPPATVIHTDNAIVSVEYLPDGEVVVSYAFVGEQPVVTRTDTSYGADLYHQRKNAP